MMTAMSGANQVPLPIDVILHSLEKFADVDVYGTIELEVSLLPEAAQSVRIAAIYDHTGRNPKFQSPVTSSRDKVQERTVRLGELHRMIRTHSHKLRILCPVTKVKVTFEDGSCKSINIVEREDLGIGVR